MTRIYFKPQGCCVRNPRSSRSAKLAPAERMKKSEQGSNWRKQLDPEAIEQIADGLEKMVLSWTSSPAVHVHERLPTPTDVDPGTLFLPPMDQLEEMMRGELINTCRPSITSGENALAGQQSAEASFWYLTPAKSQPKCLMREGQVQDTDGGSLAPSDTHIFQEMGSRSIIKAQSRWPHKWPRIQSMDNSESGSDTDAKEASSCQQIDNSLPETVSYHIKATASSEWNGSTEITAGNQVTELLGKQCMLPGNASPYTQLLETEESVDVYKKKVEELQIALLECAMEYEVKIVEMKMQMLHFKSEQRQKDGDGSCSKPGSHKLLFPTSSCPDGQQRVEYLRKQLFRLQRENLASSRELIDLKKRERQFDLQRRSLDDAVGRVNALQRCADTKLSFGARKEGARDIKLPIARERREDSTL